jgi:hypothetical protein
MCTEASVYLGYCENRQNMKGNLQFYWFVARHELCVSCLHEQV